MLKYILLYIFYITDRERDTEERIVILYIHCVSKKKKKETREVYIMKYLEIQKLGEISAFLTNLCNGDQVLNGSIEAFSCKATGNDKKFAKRLQKQLSDSVDVEKNENIQTMSATTTTITKNTANGNNQNSIGTNQSNSITNNTNLSMLPSTHRQ